MVQATCWTLVEDAAQGGPGARAEFARLYLPVVRAYLVARWRQWLGPDEVEDAVQQVFVECLREGGALERARRGAGSGFRAFLYGVARNVARSVESGRGCRADALAVGPDGPVEPAAREEALSQAFDRAWAQALLREAAARQAERARADGGDAERRVELLLLVYRDELAVAEAARRAGLVGVHPYHELERARREFQRALEEVVDYHHPGAPEAAAREFRALVALCG
jgi:RNA polymerase sigma-70 factor (ECF subfamily)